MPLECLYDMAAGFPPNNGSKREHGRRYNVFYDLTFEVKLHHFCSILSAIQTVSIQGGKGLILEAGVIGALLATTEGKGSAVGLQPLS